jgi:hypothetical protein
MTKAEFLRQGRPQLRIAGGGQRMIPPQCTALEVFVSAQPVLCRDMALQHFPL